MAAFVSIRRKTRSQGVFFAVCVLICYRNSDWQGLSQGKAMVLRPGEGKLFKYLQDPAHPQRGTPRSEKDPEPKPPASTLPPTSLKHPCCRQPNSVSGWQEEIR